MGGAIMRSGAKRVVADAIMRDQTHKTCALTHKDEMGRKSECDDAKNSCFSLVYYFLSKKKGSKKPPSIKDLLVASGCLMITARRFTIYIHTAYTSFR